MFSHVKTIVRSAPFVTSASSAVLPCPAMDPSSWDVRQSLLHDFFLSSCHGDLLSTCRQGGVVGSEGASEAVVHSCFVAHKLYPAVAAGL